MAGFPCSIERATVFPDLETMLDSSLNQLVVISDSTRVARGLRRDIYVHPHNPDLLIKVVRQGSEERRSPRWWRRTRQRYGVQIAALREVAEWIAIFTRNPDEARLVERVVGFVPTDIGLGFVVETLRTKTGEIAPTLAMLLRTGKYTPDIDVDVKAFLGELLASEIIFSDFHTSNIVYCFDAKTQKNRCVLVDGLGDKQLIPFATLSRIINRRNKRRYIRNIEAEILRIGSGGKRKIPRSQRRWFARI